MNNNTNGYVPKHTAQTSRALETRVANSAQRQGSTYQNSRVAPQRYRDNLNKKPKMKTWQKVVCIFSALIFIGAASAWGYMLHLNSKMKLNDKADSKRLVKVLEKPKSESDPFYALVLGSDSREKSLKGSRSDVIILCRIDPKKHSVGMVSIPRDTAVTIAGHGTCKINAALAYGGVSGAVDCVSKFAGVPISHYAVVNFEDVVKIVDTLGGVEVNVPQGFTTDYSGLRVPQGLNTLTGEQALAFARERYQVKGGDFARAQAQRVVVKAIVNKVLSAPASSMPALIEDLAQSVTTDMDITDIISLASEFRDSGIKMTSAACPSYCKSMNGASYVCTMLDKWRPMMQRLDAGLDPGDLEATIPEKQLNNKNLGVPQNSASPQTYAAQDQTLSVLPEDYGLEKTE